MASKIDGTNGLIQNYIYLESPAIASGFSYTVASGVQNVILNPSATFAQGTVILPASPVDGMTVGISTTQQITTFTVSPNTGQTINNAVSTLGAGQSVSYIYRQASTSWFPFSTVSFVSTLNSTLGYSQTWQTVSRVAGTTYTNSTGKPIVVAPLFNIPSNGNAGITVAGIQAAYLSEGSVAGNNAQFTAIVPPNATYIFNVSGATLTSCVELR